MNICYTSILIVAAHISDIPSTPVANKRTKKNLATPYKLNTVNTFLGVREFPSPVYIEKVMKPSKLNSE